MTSELGEFDLADFLPEALRKSCENCVLQAPEAVLPRLTIGAPMVPGVRKNFRIVIQPPGFQGKLRVALGPGRGTIRIATQGHINLDIRTWRHCDVHIGRGTTINNARIVCDNADITVGDDGLWSDDILIQSNDQHGIIDLETMELINNGRRHISIGEHVWIGRRAIVMPDVTIGRGAILGAGAILTSDMPENTIFAGVPARQVKSNVSWSRASTGFSAAERERLELPPPEPKKRT